jgi:hypothetical protein
MKAAEELVPSGRFEIRPRNAQRDGLFEEMARTALYEFRGRENMSRFYLDSIGHVLAGHILRRHCETQSHKEFSGLLSDKQLLALRRFIDEHIESGFSAPELAQQLGWGTAVHTETANDIRLIAMALCPGLPDFDRSAYAQQS